jgi:hypothetical protein
VTFNPYKRFTAGAGFNPRRRYPIHTRRGLVCELDKVCSWLVRKLYPFCVTCGEQRAHLLTCSHFYSRRYLHTRWTIENLTTQCFDCNVRHNSNPFPYLAWLIKERGDEVIPELNELRMSRIKITDADLLKLLDERRDQLAEASK